MELVQGEDLATLLRRVGRLPSEKVVDIGRQLCAGLAVAHAQGVLHRDLKPGNVLIDQDGSVRIADFGFAIARQTDDRRSSARPVTWRPSSAHRACPLSEQTDLYALGVMLVRAARRAVRPFTTARARRVCRRAVDARARRRPAARTRDPAGARAGSAGSSGLGGGDGRAAWRAGRCVAEPAPARAMGGGGSAGGAGGPPRRAVVVVRPARIARAHRPGHHRPRRLREHDRRAGLRRRAQGGARRRAGAVAVSEGVSRRPRARDAAPDAARARASASRASLAREIARREQLKALVAGSIGSLGTHYVARARSDQRRDRRRHGARAGRGRRARSRC